jgi:chromosome condensin MukBEF MukE localization factor
MMCHMPISKSDAQAYLDRWSMVRDAERDELRIMPMELKAKQLAALMESRALFGDDLKRQKEVEEVRARWARLRKVLGG